MNNHILKISVWLCIALISLTACSGSGINETTGYQPAEATDTVSIVADTQMAPTHLEPTFHRDTGIAQSFIMGLLDMQGIQWMEDRDEATFLIHALGDGRAGDIAWQEYMQVYALVAPFPTITDDIRFVSLQSFWQGEPSEEFDSLMLSQETLEVLSAAWNEPQTDRVQIVTNKNAFESWNELDTWAIMPFDELNPRWKVIRIDGVSPLDPGQDLADYPMAITFQLSGKPGSESIWQLLKPHDQYTSSNRNIDKMTRLVTSGVTALVRATAYKMETMGTTYPAVDIRDWLREADITHISNEVAFIDGCPAPKAGEISLVFCSDPKYIQLLEDVGTDVVELTGNHLNDWATDGLPLSLMMYTERGWQYFGGGSDLKDSRSPALFEHNGNKIAFIGCNDPGPDYAGSTETRGGAARCEDYSWMFETIRQLKQDGYQVVANVQYHENYSYLAGEYLKRALDPLAEAGAVIVQGSQAHTPKEMAFHQDAFIHYGLGNLFFDQMHVTIDGKLMEATRQEFIDRYTFHDNQLISIELLTAMLEDYARPRPMTPEERQALLEAVFSISDWD
ncbi:MAG: CapA family protein [Anaerolineaceae bacterium]|nr:CapA family protein [Anaerolineaceae bacterium]MBN2677913.1 CapA family protein [Anaerolineaceae bacterium]